MPQSRSTPIVCNCRSSDQAHIDEQGNECVHFIRIGLLPSAMSISIVKVVGNSLRCIRIGERNYVLYHGQRKEEFEKVNGAGWQKSIRKMNTDFTSRLEVNIPYNMLVVIFPTVRTSVHVRNVLSVHTSPMATHRSSSNSSSRSSSSCRSTHSTTSSSCSPWLKKSTYRPTATPSRTPFCTVKSSSRSNVLKNFSASTVSSATDQLITFIAPA